MFVYSNKFATVADPDASFGSSGLKDNISRFKGYIIEYCA